MEKQKKLIVAKADWGDCAAEMLRGCFVVPGALAQVAEQVEQGIAGLFTVDDGGEIVAAFVLRVDGSEGVIVAASGPVDLLLELLPEIEGRFIDCTSFRLHTARPALARLMAARGYTAQELVLRKAA